MYTEEEAKKKWCPVYGGGKKISSIDTKTQEYSIPVSNCTASKCMQWRWNINKDGANKIKRTKPGNGSDIGEFSKLGYCGLGGAPRG